MHQSKLYGEKCKTCKQIFYDFSDKNNNVRFSARENFKWHTCFLTNFNYVYVYFVRLSMNKDDIMLLYVGKSVTKDMTRFLHIFSKYLFYKSKSIESTSTESEESTSQLMQVIKFCLDNFDNICVTKLQSDLSSEIPETLFINENFNDLKSFLFLNRVVSNKKKLDLDTNQKRSILESIYLKLRESIYKDQYLKIKSKDINNCLSKEGSLLLENGSFVCRDSRDGRFSSRWLGQVNKINKDNSKDFFCTRQTPNFRLPELIEDDRFFTFFKIGSKFATSEIKILFPKMKR